MTMPLISVRALPIEDRLDALAATIFSIEEQLRDTPDADAEARLVGVLLGAVLAHFAEAKQLKEEPEVLRYVAGLLMMRAGATLPYDDYLWTEHWRTTRMAALDRAGHRCELCNVDRQLQVHHKTYERLWHERPGDLIVLCDGCHSRFHDKLAGSQR